MEHSSADLKSALDWLQQVIASRLNGDSSHTDGLNEVLPVYRHSEDSSLAIFIAAYKPTHEEFTILMLALLPHMRPDFFGKIIADYLPEGGDFPGFGGVKGTNHCGILPTGETAQFILAGNDLEKRLDVHRLLSSEHWFAQQHILWLDPVREGEPTMSGRLIIEPEVVELLTVGTISKPRFSIDFPAEHIETEMDWEDLVLHPHTLRYIREIENWITHNDTLLHDWGMKKTIKPGYRALFYESPDTGKTLTKHNLYRIKLLSMVF